jgi:hypothetical protein
MVRLLIQFGADVNVTDRGGATALTKAQARIKPRWRREGTLGIRQFLLAKEECCTIDRKHKTLSGAVRSGDLRAVQEVLAAEADPNTIPPTTTSYRPFYACASTSMRWIMKRRVSPILIKADQPFRLAKACNGQTADRAQPPELLCFNSRCAVGGPLMPKPVVRRHKPPIDKPRTIP